MSIELEDVTPAGEEANVELSAKERENLDKAAKKAAKKAAAEASAKKTISAAEAIRRDAGVGVPVEPSGALASHQEYRDALVFDDGFRIGNKHPDRTYRMVDRKIFEKGGFDSRGWRPITAENSMGERMESPWGTYSEGTSLVKDDLIACYMPIEIAHAKKRQIKLKQNLMQATLRGIRRKEGFRFLEMDAQRAGKTQEVY